MPDFKKGIWLLLVVAGALHGMATDGLMKEQSDGRYSILPQIDGFRSFAILEKGLVVNFIALDRGDVALNPQNAFVTVSQGSGPTYRQRVFKIAQPIFKISEIRRKGQGFVLKTIREYVDDTKPTHVIRRKTSLFLSVDEATLSIAIKGN